VISPIAYWNPVFRLFQNYTLPKGEVTREVHSVLADVRIEGTVRGDVIVVVGTATIASTAVIEGDLQVIAGSATVQHHRLCCGWPTRGHRRALRRRMASGAPALADSRVIVRSIDRP
jgi:hypothetical protein